MMVRRTVLQGLVLTLLLWALGTASVRAQGIELALLETHRQDGELLLDFDARVTLPRGVEDALQRGVPVYFVAEATLFRARWYWRDERLARVQRSWRVAYQPLTSTWRVGFGGFNQSFQTLGEALSVLQLVGAAIVLAGIILAQTSRPDRVIEADLALVTDTSRP